MAAAIMLSFVLTDATLAQAGSTGGTIGKQNKSVSGADEVPPPRRATPEKKSGQATTKIRAAREPKATCRNLVGTWSSWASGMFGQNDTVFSRRGGAKHSSGIIGNWRCDGGQILLGWSGSQPEPLIFSADGKQVFANGRLVFSR
jgi:hypothetical protein